MIYVTNIIWIITDKLNFGNSDYFGKKKLEGYIRNNYFHGFIKSLSKYINIMLRIVDSHQNMWECNSDDKSQKCFHSTDPIWRNTLTKLRVKDLPPGKYVKYVAALCSVVFVYIYVLL